MEWYYAEGERRLGPILEEQFEALVANGTINDSTLVWHEGMEDWSRYETVSTGAAPPPPGAPSHVTCAECGKYFSLDDVIEYQGSYVCGPCKPVFFQRVKEGGALRTDLVYGGFWIRLVAKTLDGIITGVVTYALIIPMGLLVNAEDQSAEVMLFVLTLIISYGIPIAYNTFFIGKYGATLGKMAAGLKVIRPSGERVTYLRAFGRYCGEFLSGLIFLIGYIMAAFDEEKRALHDRICDTRVIRAR